MPQAAIATQVVDFVLPLDDIAEALTLLVGSGKRIDS
jgi:chemotaxis response regulator CheB